MICLFSDRKIFHERAGSCATAEASPAEGLLLLVTLQEVIDS
jgi:hypothetical protein